MPAVAWTYSSLHSALQAWPQSQNEEYVAALPTIIGLGERRLVRDLNLEIFDREDVQESTTPGSRLVAKPTNCVALRSVGLIVDGAYQALELRSYDWCRMYAPDAAELGVPVYYAELREDEIYLVPTPDDAYPVAVRMVALPDDVLSPDAPDDTSWLASRVPDALFAACLMEAEHFLKADDRYGDFASKYHKEILPVARAELRGMIRGGDYSPFKPAAVAATS